MTASAVSKDGTGAGLFLALVSYASFIINGAFVRSEVMALSAGVSGFFALLAILPYWRAFPVYLKQMLVLLLVAIFLVAYKSLFYPVAFSFLVLVPAAIAVAIYIYNFPQYFKPRLVLYGLLVLFYSSVIFGVSPDSIFAGSRNQISTILVGFGALVLALERRTSDIILALIIFAACVLSVGSSGVLGSAFLVMATVFNQNRRWYGKALILLAVAVTFLAFQIYIEYYAPSDFTAKFSFDRLTADDARFQIISDYIDRYTTGSYLFLGAPDQYSFYVWSAISSGGTWAYVDSLHNSYLSVHAKVGALALIVYFLLFRVGFAFRSDLYLLLLFVAILVRAFGDSVYILDGYYNFSLYYLFILASFARAKHRASAIPSWMPVGPLPAPYYGPHPAVSDDAQPHQVREQHS